ncbi:hypothetical protein J7E50_21375 [Pedobacter sp. ISL-68]|uniref:hypothetical protein n=1 Tax=unclassified Pedobacter TaxID=2628915 RepID=UPI001BE78696|nr:MULTISPECIES: hypothetical protein [unclassified Pedobacter]MBT2563810.1 hypothetical protein [Pedobacter sp. ISL-64]MBT2592784.1 hypothetical protein [Pedobacter sp. ISL-68]
MKIKAILFYILLMCNGTVVFSQEHGHFLANAGSINETVSRNKINIHSLRNIKDTSPRVASMRTFVGPYALSTYVPGSTDFNAYQEPGLYEFETAGGALTNTPHGSVTSSNFKVISLGQPSRNAQLMFETSNNAVWVRNNWDWGTGMQHTPWDRLALISELGTSAFVGYAYDADAYTMARRDDGGHIKANYFRTQAILEVGSTALTGIFASSGDEFVRKFDVTSLRNFLGIPSQGETFASLTSRDNHTYSNLALSRADTPNPNTTGADRDYGSLGFFNSNFGIENARVEAYYGLGQHVDRGGLKFYTREGDGLQTRMTIWPNGNVGIGTSSPSSKLHLNYDGTALNAPPPTFGGSGIVVQATTGGRFLDKGAQIEFVIPANSDGSNAYGQGRIITVAGNVDNSNATGKMILGTRRMFDKYGNGLNWFYGDDIVIDGTGNVGVNISNPSEKLTVNGKIKAREIRVDATGMPDYVFAPNYELLPLPALEKYIHQYRHLPEVPSAAEAEKNGIALGEMNKLLLKKIEELTLHMIEHDRKMNEQTEKLKQQQMEISELKGKIK